MHRTAAGSCLAVLIIAVASVAPVQAAVDRPHLIDQMKASCYSSNANNDPAIKSKCECYARTFVESLTPGEIAVPKPSAAIQAKLRAARQACHFGDI